jgi:hypothetical protein
MVTSVDIRMQVTSTRGNLDMRRSTLLALRLGLAEISRTASASTATAADFSMRHQMKVDTHQMKVDTVVDTVAGKMAMMRRT